MDYENFLKRFDMDYEKAYKAVLQTAKQWIKDGCTDKEKICLESIFPQLRESEDERIRKKCIELIKRVIPSGDSQSQESKEILDCIAYLEKQKEHTWSPSEDEMGVLYKLCYISNQITDEDDTELTRLYQDLKREYFNGHSFENMFPSEKQKEQKQISAAEVLARAGLKPYKDGNQWCILAGDNIQEGICGFGDTIEDALYEFLKEVLDLQKEQEPINNCNMHEPTLKEAREWNEAYEKGYSLGYENGKNEQKEQPADEQFPPLEGLDAIKAKYYDDGFKNGFDEGVESVKPAEWSEEDLQHKSWILECLADGEKKMPEYAEDFQAAYKWLKSLRPQPKVELTLLDENIIEAAVAFVEQNNHFNCWRGIDKHTILKALRSLKPHWKPSEEQMAALRNVAFENGNSSLSPYSISNKYLASLYEQLKNL